MKFLFDKDGLARPNYLLLSTPKHSVFHWPYILASHIITYTDNLQNQYTAINLSIIVVN